MPILLQRSWVGFQDSSEWEFMTETDLYRDQQISKNFQRKQKGSVSQAPLPVRRQDAVLLHQGAGNESRMEFSISLSMQHPHNWQQNGKVPLI